MFKKFEIEFLPDAAEFLNNQDEKTREKILYILKKAQYETNSEILKKLNTNIWEFRIQYQSKAYRFFAFWWNKEGKMSFVIATHGILKKTQKTPLKEIRKAEIQQKQFLNNNKQG